MGLSASATEDGIHWWLSGFSVVCKMDWVWDGETTALVVIILKSSVYPV